VIVIADLVEHLTQSRRRGRTGRQLTHVHCLSWYRVVDELGRQPQQDTLGAQCTIKARDKIRLRLAFSFLDLAYQIPADVDQPADMILRKSLANPQRPKLRAEKRRAGRTRIEFPGLLRHVQPSNLAQGNDYNPSRYATVVVCRDQTRRPSFEARDSRSYDQPPTRRGRRISRVDDQLTGSCAASGSPRI
jgi:hypothetical protein